MKRDGRHSDRYGRQTPKVPQSYSRAVTESDRMNKQDADEKQDTQELNARLWRRKLSNINSLLTPCITYKCLSQNSFLAKGI